MNYYKKVLVTGGTGLVGSYLKNIKPNWIYRSSIGLDLTRWSDVKYFFNRERPDVVIHLAARVGGIMDNISYPFEYFENNLLMNTNIVKASRQFEVKKFVGMLSTCCYPDVVDTYPMVETQLHLGVPNKNNLGYAYAKRMLGVEIEMAKDRGMNYSYIIPSNLYGEYEHGGIDRLHFVGALLRKIKQAKNNGVTEIELYGDGTPLRQFTFAEDIAKILVKIIDDDICENMNVSIPEILTIDKIARIALDVTGNGHLNIRYNIEKPNGQYRKDVNIDKFINLFPNFKFTPYADGIIRTYAKLK